MSSRNEDVFETPTAAFDGRASATEIFEDLGFKKQDTVLLHSVQVVGWGRMALIILSLPNNVYWNHFIMLTSLINFYAGTTYFFFVRGHLMSFIPVYIICDLLYLFNLVLLSLHRFWSSLQERMSTVQIRTSVYVLDIISLLPQELLAIAAFGRTSLITISLRWITYIRLRHIFMTIHNLSGVLQHRWRTFMLSFVVIVAVIHHFTTCIIYHMSCHHLRCLEGASQPLARSWYSGRWSEKIVREYAYYIDDAGIWDWYFLSAYAFYEFFLTFGTGLIVPVSIEEFLVFSFIMIMGFVILDIWFLSFWFRIITTLHSYRSDYEYKIGSIRLYLSDVNVSKVVLNNIQEHFRILWEKKDGIKSSAHFDTLPSPLQMEIMYDINCTHLHRSLLFFDLKECYLRTLSLLMKHEFLLPGDVLFHQGVVKRYLVVITRGILEVLSDEDGESPIIAFQSGTVLGEASLFFSLPAKATVRAAVYSEVKLIDRVSFIRSISQHPVALKNLRERIGQRIEIARKNISTKFRTADMLELDLDEKTSLIPIKELKDRLIKIMRKDKEVQVRQSIVSQDKEDKLYTNFLSLYRLSVENSNIETPVVCLTNSFPWILDARSSFVKIWEIFVIIIHVIFMLIYGYQVVFLRELNKVLHIVRLASDFVCLFDVLLTMVTSIVLKDRVLQTFKEIIVYRLKTVDFFLNALPVIPFELLMLALDDVDHMRYQRVYDLLMGVKILRLRRCYILIRKFQREYFTNSIGYTLFSTVVYLWMISYFSGCILYLISCVYEHCNENSWFYQMILKAVNNREQSPCYLYPWMTSMYHATNIWLHVGLGDIKPVPPADLYIYMIYLFFGIIFGTYLRASLAATITFSNVNAELFQEDVMSFQRFIEHYKVPTDLKNQVHRYFELQWVYDRGTGRLQFNVMAPMHLQMVVYKKELMELLNQIPLFQLVDVDFLMDLILSSKIKIYHEGATLCYAGDVDREMYIIQKGNCSVYDIHGVLVKNLKAGDYFGEAEMLFNLSKSSTIRTTTTTKIIMITFRAFSSALSMFPAEMAIAYDVMHDKEILQEKEAIEQRRMSIFIDQHQEKEHEKNTFTTVLKTVLMIMGFLVVKFRKSFIFAGNCYRKTKGREKYWDPFRKMGKWQVLGLFFMPVTIHPESLFIKLWIFSRIILLALMGITLPFSLGFPPVGVLFTPLSTLTEVTAYIELYLFLHIGYYNKHGLLITHPKFTAVNYLKQNFIMDLIAAFPYYAIVLWLIGHVDNVDPLIGHLVDHNKHCLFRVTALLQLHRCIGFINYVKSDVLSRKNIYIFCIIVPISLLLLLVMTISVTRVCRFKFFLQRMERYQTSAMFLLYDPNEDTTYFGYFLCRDGTWPLYLRHEIRGPYPLLVLSYYWFLSVFSQVGIGDITPNSVPGMLMTVMIAFLGKLVFSYILAFLSGETGKSSIMSLEYQQKMSELLQFLRREHVAETKINKIFRYFEYVWNRTAGMENRTMLTDLHSALKGDIALFLYEKTLKEASIFKQLSRPFLRVIAKNLAEEYFLKSDIIIKCYDVNDSVYIILRGTVDILTPYDDLVTSIGIGGIFGNIHQAAPGCSSVTFTAHSNVDALKMSSVTLYLIAQEYPAVKNVLDGVLGSVGDYIRPSPGYSVLQLGSEESLAEIMRSFNSEIKADRITPRKESGLGLDMPKNKCLVCLMFFKPNNWFKFALEPDHIIFKYVNGLTFFAALYQIYMIPFMFASQNFYPYIYYSTLFLEPIFYIRIFFFLHVAYLDAYGIYVKKFRLIARNYFKNYNQVCWDIIPNLPIYLFIFMAPPERRAFLFRSLRLFHLLRGKYIFHTFHMWSKPLMARRAPILVARMFVIFATTTHYFALVAFMLFSDFGDFSRSTREYLRRATPFRAYIYCLYTICSLISTTGVGDVVPENHSEVIFFILMIMFTEVVSSLLIASFLLGIRIVSQYIISYETKVIRMKMFLQNQGLSDHLMDKLWIYIKQIWTRNNGLNMPELLQKAPYVMRCEIMTEIYSVHLRIGYLFKDINEALLRQICGHLKRVVFFKGNYIVQDGDTNASMYFIHRGQVSVLTVHPNLTETQHEMLNVHDLFGLAQGLNYGMAHKYSYRAETHCDILVLKLEIWEHVLQHFPLDKEIIFRRMLNVYTIL